MQQDQLLLSNKMKKFIYIILASALFATSCEKELPITYPDNELPIHLGYMQFSTGVSTRAQLATDMKEKSFGVLGYKYSPTTNWASAKSITAPMNDFYNIDVACAANGTCGYDAYPSDDDKSLKEWEENNYSFFAYSPYSGEGIKGISLSSKTTTNTPMLTYTYGWLNHKDTDSWFIPSYSTMKQDGEELILEVVNLCDANAPVYDLMTAEAIDVNGTSDGTVNLDFKHRMFALEVLANNYNENTEGTHDARQSITGLVLTLEGLQHSTMTIPMSMQSGETAPVYGGTAPGTHSFLISDPMMGAIIIPAFNETTEDGRGGGVATSISKLGGRDNNAGYLMLIPQTTGLSGQLNWTELKNFPGTISTNFTSNIEFKAGRLYQLYINYVGSGITIALIEAGAWDVKDVEHKFE